MPGDEGIVFTSSGPCSSIRVSVKPEPPDDLWEKLARAEEELRKGPSRPPVTFTSAEYAAKMGISHQDACKRLSRLRAVGKVRLHGASAHSYWSLAE
jgi:hypothetical protein